MSQQTLSPLRRRRLPLSVRISIGLVLAAIVPLTVTLAVSEWQARPTLIAQANTAMGSDAATRVQLIDTYFSERLLDALTVAQIPSVQTFLAEPPGNQDLARLASDILAAALFRDQRYYITWSLFDPRGQLRLFYPRRPALHGQFLLPPEDLQRGLSGKTFISSVYYDPATKKASVDLYTPVVAASTHTLLGLVQAELGIDYIWDIVSHDRGANGRGSYAFILDENGVRIADTESDQRFTAVAPLPPNIQASISSEERYGQTTPVPVLVDPGLAARLHSASPSPTFQLEPAGQSELFQGTQHTTSMVPWTYFVLSPMSTVTAVADQQLLIIGLVASVMFVVAALIGLFVGRRMTQPILRAVAELRRNSQALSILATRQKDAAASQTWIVDASQVGLQSVQYYTRAIQGAASHLRETERADVPRNRQFNVSAAVQIAELTAAQYILNATQHQDMSSQKLAATLQLATQVTEQLTTGAISATEAATQLELVVQQLRAVVGR